MEPGGLGDADEQDVREEPTETLLECMRLAADRDTIALQYANGFADVFRFVDEVPVLVIEQLGWDGLAVVLHVNVLSEIPDTLIARKCGQETAELASLLARQVRESGYGPEVRHEFDNWLRADGHRRNPGTTADMIAAILFVTLREGRMKPPEKFLNG